MSDKVGRITFGPGDTKTTTASNIIDGSGAYDRMRSERDHYRDKYHEAQARVAELEAALEVCDVPVKRQRKRIAELEADMRHVACCKAERLRVAGFSCEVCDKISKRAIKGDNDAS